MRNFMVGGKRINGKNIHHKKFKELIEMFLAYRIAMKASAATIDIRRDELKRFMLYLEAVGMKNIQAVSMKTMEAFRYCMIESDFSPYTVEHTTRAAQLLFRWLKEKKMIRSDPLAQMKIPKAPVVFGQILTEKEMQTLMTMPDLEKATGIRDRAFMEMMYTTGMRMNEAKNLSVRDVDLERETVIVKDKFGKQRILPLGKNAVKYLRLYLTDARSTFLPKFMKQPDAFWTNRFHEGWSECGLHSNMRKYAHSAGMTITTHTLRRTCAAHMLRTGSHPAAVAQMLGLADVQKLRIYLQTSTSDLMDKFERPEQS